MSGLEIALGRRDRHFSLHVELQVPGRGITALLGPSGSGKSTLLRIVAGLARPQYGRIVCNGRVWFDAERRVHLPPQARRVGLVFQDYALFAHMTVAQNVAYGLPRVRAGEARQWLQRLHLQELASRYPHQLSGGQRQRAALARALAPHPDVLLLDEPFSAVDVSLRGRLRSELRGTVAEVQRPVLFVTHDLDDARCLADRVGILVGGRLHRLGPTREVFADPGSRRAAEVLGWRNFLPVARLCGSRVEGAWGTAELAQEPAGDTDWVGIRPEHLRLATGPLPAVAARVVDILDLGAIRALECRLRDGTVVHLHRPWDEPVPAAGSRVRLHLPPHHLKPLPGTDASPAHPALPGEPYALENDNRSDWHRS